jgi:hypothetical protein
MNIQKLQVDLGEDARIETGVVQFNSDWPGVFIRGDNAVGYASCLEQALNILKSQSDLHSGCQDFALAIALVNLASLKNLLQSAIVIPE